MPENFKTQHDFLDAVQTSLQDSKADSGLRNAIVDGVRQADNALATWTEQDNPGQELRLGRWFIRNDDFPFFQLIEAIVSGALTLAASGGVEASALIGPITNFVSACWQVRRKGAKLTPEQVAVLGILSTNEGISLRTLTEKLTGLGRGISASQVVPTLRSLENVELYDGSVVPLVRSDGPMWRALRV
jgi:hypothetical protein